MTHLVAILAHNNPDLLPALISKALSAGASHVALFNGSEDPDLFLPVMEALSKERPAHAERVSSHSWQGSIEWGNMIPFNFAALEEAKRIGADYLSFWDSDLVPTREDCFSRLRAAVDKERSHFGSHDAYICARLQTHHSQSVWPGRDFPSRQFLRLHKQGGNPWSGLLEDRGWDGKWTHHAFHPGTTFGAFLIQHLHAAISLLGEKERAWNRIIITPEETALPTLAALAGCPIACPDFMRGVRWRPYFKAEDVESGLPNDMVAIHPVPRHPNFPLWNSPNPTSV